MLEDKRSLDAGCGSKQRRTQAGDEAEGLGAAGEAGACDDEAEGDDGEAVLARQEEAECGSPGCRGAWVEAMVSQRPRKKRGADVSSLLGRSRRATRLGLSA